MEKELSACLLHVRDLQCIIILVQVIKITERIINNYYDAISMHTFMRALVGTGPLSQSKE